MTMPKDVSMSELSERLDTFQSSALEMCMQIQSKAAYRILNEDIQDSALLCV